MRLLLALIVVVIWAEPLHAHELDEAEARYHQGDFLVAAELGRTLASTDGDTLAARATLVEAAFRAQKADKSRLAASRRPDLGEPPDDGAQRLGVTAPSGAAALEIGSRSAGRSRIGPAAGRARGRDAAPQR